MTNDEEYRAWFKETAAMVLEHNDRIARELAALGERGREAMDEVRLVKRPGAEERFAVLEVLSRYAATPAEGYPTAAAMADDIRRVIEERDALLRVAHRKLGCLIRDYPDDKETRKLRERIKQTLRIA